MTTTPHIRLLTRRALLVNGAVVSSSMAAQSMVPTVMRAALAAPLPALTETLEVVLPGPQLSLAFDLHGLRVQGDQIVGVLGASTHRIVVRLPGAHATVAVLGEGELPAGGAQPSVASAATRLVFDVTPPVPLTFADLTDWARWALVTDGRASEDEASADAGLSGPAAADATMLELPTSVELSPLPDVRVKLDVDGIEDGTGAPARPWITTLGRRVGPASIFAPGALVRVRAVHTPGRIAGAQATDTGDPFPRTLDAATRERLVMATGEWTAAALDQYPDHEPLVASGVTLTRDGASGALSGTWTGPGQLDAATLVVSGGRTESAAIVGAGVLLPFGHRAALTETTVREVTYDDQGVPTEALRREQQLVVPGGTVLVSSELPHQGRGVPFRDVTAAPVTSHVTELSIPGVDPRHAHLLGDADGNVLQVACTATDRGGATVQLSTPMVFIAAEMAADPTRGGVLDIVLAWLETPENLVRFTIKMDSQPLQLVDIDDPADAPLVIAEVENLLLGATVLEDGRTPAERIAEGRIAFGPSIDTLAITTPTLDALVGNSYDATTVRFDAAYLAHGFGAQNPTGAWARLDVARDTASLRPGSSLAAPDLSIEVLGLALGASSDLSGPDGWDPASAVPDTARVFGVALRDLLPTIEVGDSPADQPELPRICAELTGEGDDAAAELCLRWEPSLQTLVLAGTPTFIVSDDLDTFGLDDPWSAPTAAEVTITETVALGPQASPSTEVVMDLRRFAVQVPPGAPVATVWLERATFTDIDGERDVAIDVEQVGFTGSLNFLQPLQELLDKAGVALLPPYEAGVITAGVAISVPGAQFGIIAVDGFTAELGMRIPLTNDPATVFVTLGTEDEPIGVSLLGIGGGAWFDIEVGGHPHGIVRLDAGLSVGVELSINVIIAKAWISGSLSAGVRLTKASVEGPDGLNETTNVVELFAAVQLAAGLNLLGLVEINGQVDLELAYVPLTKLLSGAATLTFTSETLWGTEKTKSKTFETSYSLGDVGLDGQVAAAAQDATATPTFADRFPEDRWLDYGAAFA